MPRSGSFLHSFTTQLTHLRKRLSRLKGHIQQLGHSECPGSERLPPHRLGAEAPAPLAAPGRPAAQPAQAFLPHHSLQLTQRQAMRWASPGCSPCLYLLPSALPGSWHWAGRCHRDNSGCQFRRHKQGKMGHGFPAPTGQPKGGAGLCSHLVDLLLSLRTGDRVKGQPAEQEQPHRSRGKLASRVEPGPTLALSSC